MRRRLSKPMAVVVAALVLASVLMTGCNKSTGQKSTPASAAAKKPQTPFENDLDYVRKGQFIYVFVFQRQDGAPFTSDDKAYLKANSPAETNQWISTDEGRRIIAGTNFEFKPEHFDALNRRFKVEDYTGR